MKLIYIFLFLVLVPELFSHRTHLKTKLSKAIGDDNEDESPAAESSGTSETENAATEDSSDHSSSYSSHTSTSSSSSWSKTTSTSETTTETSDVAETSSGAFLDMLKDKTWVYSNHCPEKKKNYSQMTKVPGNSNLSVQKKEILNKKIFSIGYSLPITEILSKFLAEPFKKEVSEAYQSFANGASNLQVPTIKKGMSTNHWKLEGNLEDLAEFMYGTYNVDGEEGLSEREFAYMMIDNVYSYAVNYECKSCLKSSRYQISKLFEFLDYDMNGYTQAIDLFAVFSHMKGGEDLKTVNVNEWLLKEDIRQIGRLGLEQFTEAVLKSLYEHQYL